MCYDYGETALDVALRLGNDQLVDVLREAAELSPIDREEEARMAWAEAGQSSVKKVVKEERRTDAKKFRAEIKMKQAEEDARQREHREREKLFYAGKQKMDSWTQPKSHSGQYCRTGLTGQVTRVFDSMVRF